MTYYVLFLHFRAVKYKYLPFPTKWSSINIRNVRLWMCQYHKYLKIPASIYTALKKKKSPCPMSPVCSDSEQTCAEDKSTIWSLCTAQTSAPDRIAAGQMHDGTLVHWQFGQWGSPKNLRVSAQSRHVICLHLDTHHHIPRSATAYECVCASLCLLIVKNNLCKKRFPETTRKERIYSPYKQVGIFVCACVWPNHCQWDYGKSHRDLFSRWKQRNSENWEPLVSSEVARPDLRLKGWVGCCFLTTWNAIYLSTWPSIQAGRSEGGADGDERAA